MRLTLPWPPSINHYRIPVVMGKSARLVTSQAGRDYRERALRWITEQFREDPRTFTDPVCVRLLLCPERHGCDIDNRLKPILDALEAARILSNDKIVRRLVVDFGEKEKEGRVHAEITHLEEHDDNEHTAADGA